MSPVSRGREGGFPHCCFWQNRTGHESKGGGAPGATYPIGKGQHPDKT